MAKTKYPGVYRRSPTGPYHISYYVDGKLIRETTRCRNQREAAQIRAERLTAARSGQRSVLDPKLTIANLLDDLLRDFETHSKSLSWARYVDGHLRPFFGPIRANRLSTEQIEVYVTERLGKVSGSTVNRELTLLHRAFTLARDRTPPKILEIPRFPNKLSEPPPRQGFFSDDEFLALRRELPEEIRPVLTLAYYSGCRKGEILSLRWTQPDFEARLVRLDRTKNGEPRDLPMNRELFEMLSMLREMRDRQWPGSPWVFSRSGRPIKDFRYVWDRACKRVGLWDTGRTRPTRLFHDLRRTGVRNLIRAGVPEKVAMLISGHKSRSIFSRYNIVDEQDLRLAAQKLDQYLETVREKPPMANPLSHVH